jgi:hypothetical protein
MLYFKPALHLALILFFAAYVMSSGPRYVRQFREREVNKGQSLSPGQAVKNSFIRPYVRIWQSWRPVIKQGLALIRVQGLQATGT